MPKPVTTLREAIDLLRQWARWAEERDEDATTDEWLWAAADYIEHGRYKGSPPERRDARGGK